jgi:hypothetical protein
MNQYFNSLIGIIKKLQYYLFFLVLILLTGCMSNSPSKTAEKFLTAVMESDYEKAREYSTSDTGKLIDLLESLNSLSGDSEFQEMNDGNVKILAETIDGSIAWVDFTYSSSEEVEKIELRQVDGMWLAHITKEDISEKGLLDTSMDSEQEETSSKTE